MNKKRNLYAAIMLTLTSPIFLTAATLLFAQGAVVQGPRSAARDTLDLLNEYVSLVKRSWRLNPDLYIIREEPQP